MALQFRQRVLHVQWASKFIIFVSLQFGGKFCPKIWLHTQCLINGTIWPTFCYGLGAIHPMLELKLVLTSTKRNHLAVTVGLLAEMSHLQFNPAASGKPQWRRINSKRDLFTGHQCNQVTPSLMANHIASSSRARCRHRHRGPSEFRASRSRHFD